MSLHAKHSCTTRLAVSDTYRVNVGHASRARFRLKMGHFQPTHCLPCQPNTYWDKALPSADSIKMVRSETQHMASTFLWQPQILTIVVLLTCDITIVIGSSANVLIRNAVTCSSPFQQLQEHGIMCHYLQPRSVLQNTTCPKLHASSLWVHYKMCYRMANHQCRMPKNSPENLLT